MKINLGNILFILLILQLSVFSSVKIDAPDSFYDGDQIVFSITCKGNDVKFPKIDKIDNYSVKNIGTSSSTTILNGVRTQTLKRSFAFAPNNEITLPSFTINIDGKDIKTKPKKIKMRKIEKTISSNYELTLSVDKKDVYVGEGVVLKLFFKYNKNLPIVDLQFRKPSFENFWVKELQVANSQKNSSDFVTQELHYLLFPQKSGKLDIKPLKISMVTMANQYNQYSFFSQSSTKTIPVYSNNIMLNVKSLPNNLKLIGDFSIESSIDKNSIKQGEAVSFNLKIKGRGNLDDIEEIKLDIQNTTIYDNPSKKDFDIKDGKYGGVFTKTYSIVASEDFIIPSIKLQYFDKTTNSTKTIKTEEYNIKVSGQIKQQPKLQIDTSPTNTHKIEQNIINKVIVTSDKQKIIYFIVGFITAILLIGLYKIIIRFKSNKIQQQTPLENKVKSIKETSQLLNLLVAYINIDDELDKIIYQLEKNELNKDLKSTKKDILKIIKDKKLDLEL